MWKHYIGAGISYAEDFQNNLVVVFDPVETCGTVQQTNHGHTGRLLLMIHRHLQSTFQPFDSSACPSNLFFLLRVLAWIVVLSCMSSSKKNAWCSLFPFSSQPQHPVLSFPLLLTWLWFRSPLSLIWKNEVKISLSCVQLCNPMDCSPPGYSVHEILQARILEWVAIPFSRESSKPRDQTWVSCIAGRFITITGSDGKNPYLGSCKCFLLGTLPLWYCSLKTTSLPEKSQTLSFLSVPKSQEELAVYRSS